MSPFARDDDQLLSRGVTLAILCVVLTAGCLGGGPGSDGQPATPATSQSTDDATTCPPIATPTQQATTPTDTPQEGTPTATTSGFTHEPDAETPVVLYNDFSEQVDMRVHVSCAATGEAVHNNTYLLVTGGRREPVNLATFTPEGAGSSVTVDVTVRNTSQSVTFDTTDCGDVTARLTDDGELRVGTTAC